MDTYTAAPHRAEAIGPVPGEDRITVIDCLRGAALFGILTANMRGFNAPFSAYIEPWLMWTWLPDRLMQSVVDWLVQGKFITIFAALFGIGFAIQMDRAAARMQNVGFYGRRMAGLLGIGLAHSFLLWWGDILVLRHLRVPAAAVPQSEPARDLRLGANHLLVRDRAHRRLLHRDAVRRVPPM